MNARSGILLFSAIASLALGLLAVPARAQDQHTLHLAGVTADGELRTPHPAASRRSPAAPDTPSAHCRDARPW